MERGEGQDTDGGILLGLCGMTLRRGLSTAINSLIFVLRNRPFKISSRVPGVALFFKNGGICLPSERDRPLPHESFLIERTHVGRLRKSYIDRLRYQIHVVFMVETRVGRLNSVNLVYSKPKLAPPTMRRP